MYTKESQWRSDGSLPEALRLSARSTTIVDEASGAVRRIQYELLLERNDRFYGGKPASASGFRSLPGRSVAIWTQLFRPPPRPRPRQLFEQSELDATEIPLHELTRGSLRSTMAPPTVRATQNAARRQRPGGDPYANCGRAIEEKAGELVTCVAGDDMTARGRCVSELHELWGACPNIDVLSRLEAAVSEGCVAADALFCGGLINALAYVGPPGAQSVIARYVSETRFEHFSQEAFAVLHTIHRPEEPLLEALAARVDEALIHEQAGAGAGGLGSEGRGAMLLAAASAAGAADRDRHSAGSRIALHVERRLREAAQAEAQRWAPVHAEVKAKAEEHWERMPFHEREAWMAHEEGLHHQGLAIEFSRGRQLQLASRARGSIGREWLQRHGSWSAAEGWSAAEEQAHHDGAVLALRAYSNLAPPANATAVGRIAPWLDHREDYVAEAAVDALRSFEGPHAEEHLLRALRARLEPVHDGTCQWADGRDGVRVATRALHTLLEWERISERAYVEAMHMMVKMPNHGYDEQTHDSPCAVECRATCNPHLEVKACREHCLHKCKTERGMRKLLGTLLKKGSEHPNGHDLEALLRRHDPAMHPTWEERARRRLNSFGRHRSAVNRSEAVGDWSELEQAGFAVERDRRKLGFFGDFDFDKFSLTAIDIKIG